MEAVLWRKKRYQKKGHLRTYEDQEGGAVEKMKDCAHRTRRIRNR